MIRGHVHIEDILARIDQAMPRASILPARIVAELMRRPDATMAIADLGDVLGRGRNSTAVQNVCRALEEIGVLRRFPDTGVREAGGHGLAVALISGDSRK